MRSVYLLFLFLFWLVREKSPTIVHFWIVLQTTQTKILRGILKKFMIVPLPPLEHTGNSSSSWMARISLLGVNQECGTPWWISESGNTHVHFLLLFLLFRFNFDNDGRILAFVRWCGLPNVHHLARFQRSKKNNGHQDPLFCNSSHWFSYLLR